MYHIITDNKLDSFYQRKTNSHNKFPSINPLEHHDLVDFKNEFVMNNQVILISLAIHFVSCVWLIEQTIVKTPKVISARANFNHALIHITF